NVAAELAAERAKTPAAFKGELFDRLYALAPETVDCRQKLKIKEVQG
ncbi:MAG: hydroxyethylthiazole kinase, partial [Firmicutes bacterium]|nr:hydroxyethylthiazole kinase [Bacillota bacterium]